MAVGRQRKMGEQDHQARRVRAAYRLLPTARSAGGWTLIELVITMTIMAILSVGIIPLVKTAVKRQREFQLRDNLRTMREAIKEFHRDTVGMPATAGIGGTPISAAPVGPVPGTPGTPGGAPGIDPRSRVVIADPTIFGVDNLERYPPSLDILVSGVAVVPRLQPVGSTQSGELPKLGEGGLLGNKKKIYLREIPKDPITGKTDWCFHSPFDDPGQCSDSTDAGIFDVTSRADGTALDGTKYSVW